MCTRDVRGRRNAVQSGRSLPSSHHPSPIPGYAARPPSRPATRRCSRSEIGEAKTPRCTAGPRAGCRSDDDRTTPAPPGVGGTRALGAALGGVGVDRNGLPWPLLQEKRADEGALAGAFGADALAGAGQPAAIGANAAFEGANPAGEGAAGSGEPGGAGGARLPDPEIGANVHEHDGMALPPAVLTISAVAGGCGEPVALLLLRAGLPLPPAL